MKVTVILLISLIVVVGVSSVKAQHQYDVDYYPRQPDNFGVADQLAWLKMSQALEGRQLYETDLVQYPSMHSWKDGHGIDLADLNPIDLSTSDSFDPFAINSVDVSDVDFSIAQRGRGGRGGGFRGGIGRRGGFGRGFGRGMGRRGFGRRGFGRGFRRGFGRGFGRGFRRGFGRRGFGRGFGRRGWWGGRGWGRRGWGWGGWGWGGWGGWGYPYYPYYPYYPSWGYDSTIVATPTVINVGVDGSGGDDSDVFSAQGLEDGLVDSAPADNNWIDYTQYQQPIDQLQQQLMIDPQQYQQQLFDMSNQIDQPIKSSVDEYIVQQPQYAQ